jgi:hypothetical protein
MYTVCPFSIANAFIIDGEVRMMVGEMSSCMKLDDISEERSTRATAGVA